MKTTHYEFYPIKNRPFIMAWHFNGWFAWQLGFHIDLQMLNLEIHIPFGFIRIGKDSTIGIVNYTIKGENKNG